MSSPSSPMPDNIDYARTANVARLHAAVAREAGEPAAQPVPISLWAVVAIAVVSICAGSFFSGALSDHKLQPPAGASTGGGLSDEELHQPANWILAGKSKYSQCTACHGANGEGQPGQFPPLKGSEFVIHGEKRLVAILLHGLSGPLTVDGKPYNNVMPKLGGAASMTDKDLAQLLSYIRNEWGNKASVIYEDQIKALKGEIGDRPGPFTEAEIRAIPQDAPAPPSAWPAKLEKAAAGAAAPAAAAPAAAAPAPAPAK